MNTITLAVMKKSFDYVKKSGDINGRQLAIKGASPEIRAAINKSYKTNPAMICLGECLVLIVGDTDAILRRHNIGVEDEFDALFELLALNQDKPMVFACEFSCNVL